MKIFLLSSTLVLQLLVFSICQAETKSAKPNIILVMADDQGWGDTSYNGHPQLKTPHLDEMSKSGLRLNRFYTAHFNCSPTRASIMTGRHPARYGTFSPGAPMRIQEQTFASALQSHGYNTGHFGKWHLNGKNGDKNTREGNGRAILLEDPLSPGKRGFNQWVSADNFFDQDPVLGVNGVPQKFHGDSSDVTMNVALKFIEEHANKNNPFLAVIWFGSPHNPHDALPQDKTLYADLTEPLQNYYGEITAVDRNVGLLRQSLQKWNIYDNTLLWYCSDNGGAQGPLSTGNLRGSKGNLWEGGVRVPGLVNWPARIPTPFSSDVPCSTLDMYPTILAATGIIPEHQIEPLDGMNILPLFDRKMNERKKPIPFYAYKKEHHGHATLNDWPYKLHLNPTGLGKKNDPKTKEPAPQVMLFNIETDPKETTNIADKFPERVTTMKATLETWKLSVHNSLDGKDYPN